MVIRVHFILHVSAHIVLIIVLNCAYNVNYERLFGRPPFNSDNDDELEELVSEGKYSFPTSVHVSDDGMSVVNDIVQLLM